MGADARKKIAVSKAQSKVIATAKRVAIKAKKIGSKLHHALKHKSVKVPSKKIRKVLKLAILHKKGVKAAKVAVKVQHAAVKKLIKSSKKIFKSAGKSIKKHAKALKIKVDVRAKGCKCLPKKHK